MPQIVGVGQLTINDTNDGLSATLSNDGMSLPADKDGVVSSYAGCSTTMFVYLGGTDDSPNWIVTAAPSTGVVGSFGTGIALRTYTVTSLTANSAYVDITATKAGYPAITKRFSLSISKAGTDGTSVKGDPGPEGLSYVKAYCASSIAATSTAPPSTLGKTSLPPDNSGGLTGTYVSTVPSLTTNQRLWVTDGQYNPATDYVTWGIPYWSSLKVGTISAISSDLGTITAGSIDIGTSSTSWHVDNSGNQWAGGSTYASAPFRVSNGGAVAASNLTITGGSMDIGTGSTSWHVDSAGNQWAGAPTYGTAPFRVSNTGAVVASNLSLVASNGSTVIDPTGLKTGFEAPNTKNSDQLWSDVNGVGKPADNATSDITLVGRGASVLGNSATRTTGVNGWAADVYSKECYSGGAYASVVAGDLTSNFMFGLNTDPTTDSSFSSLDYAIQLKTDVSPVTVRVYENNVFIYTTGTPFAVGDVFTVVYDGSSVKYMQNGTVFYTSQNVNSKLPNQTFYFDSSLASAGAKMSNIRFGPLSSNNWVSIGGTGKPSDNASSDLVLIGRNATVTGNTAVKTGGTNGTWDADVYSADSFTGGAYASAVVVDPTKAAMFGLNSDPTTDSNWTSLDYALYVTTAGNLYVRESNTAVGPSNVTCVAGDVLAVIYDGSSVKYLKNGSVFHTSASANASVPNQVLYFDSSFYSAGASFRNMRFGPLSSNNWNNVGGTGKPQDNATVGANASNFTGTLGGDNLMNNSSFEIQTTSTANKPNAYDCYNTAGISNSWVSVVGRLGGRAFGIKANATGASTWGLTTKTTLVENGVTGGVTGGWQPNKTYMVSFKAKKVNGAAWTNCILQWNTSPVSTVAVSNPNLTTSWQTYSFRITMGATVESAGQLFIDRIGSIAINDEFHIDELIVQEGDIYSEWFPSPRDAYAALDAISSDNVLSKGEKSDAIQKWNTCDKEWLSLLPQASALGVSSTAYDNAHGALSSYLLGLSPYWADTTLDTPIVGSDWRTMWNAYYDEKQKLINAMAAKAATSANTDGNIRTPVGSTLDGQTSGMKGAIKITLPQSWTSSMLKFTVDIYEYLVGYACTMEIAGYAYAGSGQGWYNVTARVLGGSNVEYPVYFGHDGTKCAVWIGTKDDTWDYPKARVRDVFVTHSNTSKSLWETGWSVSLDPVGVINASASVADTMPGADWSKSSKRPANLAALTGNEAIQNSIITMNPDGSLNNAGGGKVTLPGMGQNTFRIVTCGSSNTVATPALGFYINGVIQYSPTVTMGRSWNVVALNRSTGSIAWARTYDVYVSAAEAARMAADLNGLGTGYIVVVFTYDEPQANRLTNGLDTAMYRCGASRAVFGSTQFQYRSAYVLIGIPGCGEGNGAEGYQGSVASDTNAWVDMSFDLLNGALSGVSNAYTPRSLTDYGYTGSLNASSDITLIGRGCVVTGNSFRKNSGTNAWDADCYSLESFTGGAYVSARVTDATLSTFIGLDSNPTESSSYATIDYGFYHEGPNIYIFHNNSQVTPSSIGTTVAGDLFTVRYDGSKMDYEKNGVVIYSEPVPAGLKLYMDSAVYHNGTGWDNVRFGPMSSNNWASVGGAGKPEDNATYITPGKGSAINDDPTIDKLSAWTIPVGIAVNTGAGDPSPCDKYFASTGAYANLQVYSARKYAVDSAKTYSLTAMLYAAAGNTQNMYLFVNFYNGNGQRVSAGSWGGSMDGYTFGGLPPAGSWTRQGSQFGTGTSRPIPVSARSMEIGVWFHYSNGSSNVLQGATDIRLEQVISQSLIDPAFAAVLTNKLNANASSVLTGPMLVSSAGGIGVGSLTWNTSGGRTGGYGVGITSAGIAAYNSSGVATFVLDAGTGNATFNGTIAAKTVTASSLNITSLDSITQRIGTLRTGTSGARTEIIDNVIKVYDGSNILRVKIGDLSL